MPASFRFFSTTSSTITSAAMFAKPRQCRNFVVLLLLASVMVVLAGCGPNRPDRVPVSGQVLINGEPLKRGFVRFVHSNARASYGKIGPDGRFTLTCFDGQDGAVPGHFQVEVTSNEGINENSMRWFAPKHYANYETSGIELDIEEATDDIKIELEGDDLPFVEVFGK